MTLIEVCFISLSMLAAICTWQWVEVAGYWLAKQRAKDRKEAEIQEKGFE